MTDRRDPRPTPDDGRPDGRDTGDAADARWFRDVVAPVVDARPVPDGWREIAERVGSTDPTVVHLAPARPDRPGRATRSRRGHQLLVAAVVLAVIGMVATFVLTRGGDDDPQTVVAVPGPEDDATGWYVPSDLPDGWVLDSVATDWLDVEGPDGSACPCTTTAWTDDDTVIVVGSYLDPSRQGPEPGSPRTVSLGAGVTAWVDDLESATVLTWAVDGTTSSLTARGLSRDQAVDAARILVEDPTSTPPSLVDLTLRSSQTVPAGTRAYRSVLVTLVHPASGHHVEYGLLPPGFDGGTGLLLAGGAWTTVRLDGQDLPLERFEIDLADGAAPPETLYLGRWPGADVFVGRYVEPAASEALVDGDLQLLAASLRPATAEEWAAFLDTATGPVEEDARADRLADLVVHEGDPSDDDTPGTPTDTTDTTGAPATETTEPDGSATDTTVLDVGMTEAMTRAQQLVELAPQIVAGTAPVPAGLFAPTVDLGLGPEVVRRVGAPNLVSADAWVIDEDDGVESYAGRVPPFSAIGLLTGVDAEDLAVAPGGPEGCAAPPPPAPELDHDWVLVTITPTAIDSCIDWFAVTLVVDRFAGIVGVHLYLIEP